MDTIIKFILIIVVYKNAICSTKTTDVAGVCSAKPLTNDFNIESMGFDSNYGDMPIDAINGVVKQ